MSTSNQNLEDQAPDENARIFGLSSTPEDSDIILLAVPWDATTSFGNGCFESPEYIRKASHQLDFYSPHFNYDFMNQGVYLQMTEQANIEKLRHSTINKVHKYRSGSKELRADINHDCEQVRLQIYNQTKDYLQQNKKVGVIGGDHSAPLGYMQAIDSEQSSPFDIIHFDAHLDLRDSYEGLQQSHASIMFNASKTLKNLNKIFHIGVRDFCKSEEDFAKASHYPIYDDMKIYKDGFQKSFDEIITQVTDHYYLSIDVDGLDPSFCPNTGTPVPGGIGFLDLKHAMSSLKKSQKDMIGFDICETGADDYDANVAARITAMCCSLL